MNLPDRLAACDLVSRSPCSSIITHSGQFSLSPGLKLSRGIRLFGIPYQKNPTWMEIFWSRLRAGPVYSKPMIRWNIDAKKPSLMVHSHCPTTRQTETKTDSDTNKLAQKPTKICVGVYVCVGWTPSNNSTTTHSLSVSVSRSVNKP